MDAIDIFGRALATGWVLSSGLIAADANLGGRWQRWFPFWLRVVIAAPIAFDVCRMIWTAP